MTDERKARSPYQKKGKTEFRYSAEITGCIKACRDGKRGDYDRLNAAFWAKQMPEIRRWQRANGYEPSLRQLRAA